MKVLICGSRGHNADSEYQELKSLLNDEYEFMWWYDLTVIHGACPNSPDEFGDRLKDEFPQLTLERFPADWERLGKRAGFARNVEMVQEAPDLVVALWDGHSKGTLHTITLAVQHGIPVRILPVNELPKHPPK
jgi:hypothetical protein